MQNIWFQSLGQEDSLEEEMATPVLLPWKSHGQRSLVGYSSWGCRELDTTWRLNSNNKPASWAPCVNARWLRGLGSSHGALQSHPLPKAEAAGIKVIVPALTGHPNLRFLAQQFLHFLTDGQLSSGW